jgi:hypothetical protein
VRRDESKEMVWLPPREERPVEEEVNKAGGSLRIDRRGAWVHWEGEQGVYSDYGS